MITFDFPKLGSAKIDRPTPRELLGLLLLLGFLAFLAFLIYSR